MSVVEPIRRTRKELAVNTEVENLELVGALEKPKKQRKPATEEQKQKGRDNLARGRALLAEKRAAKLKAEQEIAERTSQKEEITEPPKQIPPKEEVIPEAPVVVKKPKKVKKTVVYESDSSEEEIVVVKKKPKAKKIVYQEEEPYLPNPPPAPKAIQQPSAVLRWV
jgi:hypothetical protein